MPGLQLILTEYIDRSRWRWELRDARGRHIADHGVRLNPKDPLFRAFWDLPRYLWQNSSVDQPYRILRNLGTWMGGNVLGPIAHALLKRLEPRATIVQVKVPLEAQCLLSCPLELAWLNGLPLTEQGVQLVYHFGDRTSERPDKHATDTVRVLAVFSLPDGASPLNLRGERRDLEQLGKRLRTTQGAALEVRVLQYGATRRTLEEALDDGEGWDVIHFSGHGLTRELMLETSSGQIDRIPADELQSLLRPTAGRLKLLTLSACLSGAGGLAAARAQLGLNSGPHRDTISDRGDDPPVAPTENLPSLAQALSEALDCAVLAMRYPVGDSFASRLLNEVYTRLFERQQRLPAALQSSLKQILSSKEARNYPPLSRFTPLLFGAQAIDLQLFPPKQLTNFEMPTTGLFGFPAEPERFVGRLQPMLRASLAMAPESQQRGILFHGMAGAGKTSCALELAYRHEAGRFTGQVWYRAPDEDKDIATALCDFLQALDTQLGMSVESFIAYLDDPARFEQRTLFRLKGLLETRAILIVIDNLEGLLTTAGNWRDARWGALLATLLEQRGYSRVVLTSRRVPASLGNHQGFLLEPINALSLPETLILAREMRNLGALFESPRGQAQLRNILTAVQGHPKLLELADRMAAHPDVLEADLHRVRESEQKLGATDIETTKRSFLETGESRVEEKEFISTLHRWTAAIVTTLPVASRLAFQFLSCLEEDDRQIPILDRPWSRFLKEIPNSSHAENMAGNGLKALLEPVVTAGLIDAKQPAQRGSERATGTLYVMHPEVANAARASMTLTMIEAIDHLMGSFWVSIAVRAATEMAERRGPWLIHSSRQGTLYLIRRRRWQETAALLEQLNFWDPTPATKSWIVSVLRNAVDELAKSPLQPGVKSILAKALVSSHRNSEAAPILRELVDGAESRGDLVQASQDATSLIEVLLEQGLPQDALELSERTRDLTRRAGLGPWTQIYDEGNHLAVLLALGRYEEVFETGQRLWTLLNKLPGNENSRELVQLWVVQERLLHTGLAAAVQLGRWDNVLEMNHLLINLMTERGAHAVEIATFRFNDYAPLLSLRRYDEARELLESCYDVFAAANRTAGIAKVLAARADLEDRENHPAEAVHFAEASLRYLYQGGGADTLGAIHYCLAIYLKKVNSPPTNVLAHFLASALIFYQTEAGQLRLSLSGLAIIGLPAVIPAFEQVVTTVNRWDGVSFDKVFAQLPLRAPNGDAAIAAIWALAIEEEVRYRGHAEKLAELTADLPAEIRDLFEQRMVIPETEFLTALGEVPPGQLEAFTGRLLAANLMPPVPDTMETRAIESLVRDILAVAQDAKKLTGELEAAFKQLEKVNPKLIESIRRIWAGERDPQRLLVGIQPMHAMLLQIVLEALLASEGSVSSK